MFAKLWASKVIRFAVVGVFNTLLDLTILNVLALLGHLPVVVAKLTSATISMCVSYFLNHHLVFRSPEPHSPKRFIHFFVVTGFGILAIQGLTIYSVTHLLGHHDQAVSRIIHSIPVVQHLSIKAVDLNVGNIVAVAIAMCWNFTIYRLVIFKQHPEVADEADFKLSL